MITDERILGLCELSNDLLYYKIPKDKRAYYVDASLKMGQEEAVKYMGQNIEALYQKHNIEIVYQKKSSNNYGISYRGQAEMSPTINKVTIYEQSIEDLANKSLYQGEYLLTNIQAKDIHLAHEFFHFLEYQSLGFVPDKLESVIHFKFLGFQRKGTIRRCSEIAAHSFAKTLLSLQFLPNVYDYLYLIESGRLKRADFDSMLLDMQAQLYNH